MLVKFFVNKNYFRTEGHKKGNKSGPILCILNLLKEMASITSESNIGLCNKK